MIEPLPPSKNQERDPDWHRFLQHYNRLLSTLRLRYEKEIKMNEARINELEKRREKDGIF